MRNLIALLVVGCALALVACNNGGGGGGGDSKPTHATTPQPCNNQQGVPGSNVNCQNYQNYYNQYPGNYNWQYGSWYWPQQYQPGYGNCGCSGGYFPVQGPFGVACAPTGYFMNYSYQVVYISWGSWFGYWSYPQNYGWTNFQQQPYQNTNYSSCQQSTAQGCDVRLNNCPSGSRCQPTGGGSTIGLCVR